MMETFKIKIKLQADKIIYRLWKLKLNRQMKRLLDEFSPYTYENIRKNTPIKTWLLNSRTKIKSKSRWYRITNTSTKKMYYNIFVHRDRKKPAPTPFFDIWIRKSMKKFEKLEKKYIDTRLKIL